MTKIGIYSGSFDPVHTGHIALAQSALQAARFDQVIMIPESNPRSHSQLAPFEHRLAMLRLAAAGHEGIAVATLQSQRFSFTDTLPELYQLYPGAILYLIIGSDVVDTFKYRWPGLEDLVTAMPLLVGLRGTDTKASVTTVLEQLQAEFSKPMQFRIIHTNYRNLAATHIRQGKHEITDLDPAVAAYISLHKLYY